MRNRLLVVLLIGISALAALAADACGPYPYDTRFWFGDRSGVAEHRVIRGELGVFEPGYSSAWIFAAWRQLTGLGLMESDHGKLIRLVSPDDAESREGTRAWDAAREEVAGEGIGWLDTTREKSASEDGQRSWTWFDNCLTDAFETAAETLRARVAEYGEDDVAVREWIRGQDAVFENCSGDEVVPEPASADWPEWLQKDRAYQRAAAALYSERYDEAAGQFADIAADAESPWRPLSGYLVGRALARGGRHDEAIEQYRAVLANPAAAEFHGSARGLIDHLRYRSDADALRADIVSRLSASPLPETLAQDLVDFHRLAARRAFGGEGDGDESASDPLTDWYVAVKGWNSPAEVVERWRAEREGPHSEAWRWAALLRANATEIVFDDGREYEALPGEAIDELLAAETFEPGDTGAVSEAYHQARLLLDVGRDDEAIPILESAVQGEYGSVATADTNLFLAQRLRAARSLDEIVRFGQMYPTEVGWNYDESEPLAEGEEIPTWKGGPLWHLTAAKTMNGLSPRTMSMRVTPESVDDELLRAETLRVAWTRAVVLEDGASVVELARRLMDVDKSLAPQLEPLLSVPGVERAFLASLVILRFPGLHPDLHWGVSRPTAVDELDAYYSDWWCSGDSFDLPEPADLEAMGAASPENLDALRRLKELPSAPIWLGQRVLDYADAHPDDPRVPEALHRVVRATRHGCDWNADGFGEVSKAAFQRLHQRYPQSSWTEQTPYWFD